MANIVIPFAAVTQNPVPTAGFNNNFTEVANKFNAYAVQTDVAKVIGVTHTFSVAQNIAGLNMTGDILFTDATYDLGKAGATRPRDGFFSRNLTVGLTMTATTLVGALSAASLSGTSLPAAIVTSSLQTFGVLGGNLLFTDATYDIGASGANRPRDGFFSRNMVVGGALNTGGAVTIAAGGLAVTGGAVVSTGDLTVSAGGVIITGAGNTVAIGGNNVLGSRKPGWATQTGSQTRADMGASPSAATVASTLDALIMDLRSHGMI
jgi:adhesin HecA-like repeat protein